MKMYEILNVDRKATNKEIKAAYRKLAKKYHPDKKGGDEEMFKQIQKAYDVLGDNKKREHYDRTGDTERTVNSPEKILMGVFAAIIESGDFSGNIIKRVKSKLKDQVDLLKRQKNNGEKELKKILKMQGRINSDGENLFEGVLLASIDRTKQSIDAIEVNIGEAAEVMVLLNHYVDASPQERKNAPHPLAGLVGFGNNRFER